MKRGIKQMKLFYCRVSTEQQNEERQIKAAESLGIEKENIFIDKQSGKNMDRNQLKRLLDFCRKGDIVYCESISRIARNTKDLLNIIEQLKEKQVEFVSLKESIDTTNPQGKFMLTVFGALAELERECILQRQAEGIAVAKSKGLYKGRKPKDINQEEFKRMCAEWRQGKRTAVSIHKKFNISAQTFYRWVKEQNL
jgi:DNA invertase Pin-like site-specific DNA recombinase